MNRPPEIIINNGYPTDENGVLTEMVIPPHVKSLNAAPTVITTYATEIKWLPNTTSTLVSLNAPEVISFSGAPQKFLGSINVTNINFPKLTTLSSILFFENSRISTIRLPRVRSVSTETFTRCMGLTSVAIGSAGYGVTSISSNAFNGCTQSGLTITVYTQGGASLSGEPWGATNATIEYEEA